MHRVLIIGAGNIGATIAFLFAHSTHYEVYLADKTKENPYETLFSSVPNFNYVQLDATQKKEITRFIQQHDISALISCLPFFCNVLVAEIAADCNIHYFDLTEDVATAQTIKILAEKNPKTIFVPQCGLAPGFISIIAQHLIQRFQSLESVKLRVGALPANISNALQYSLTWSTDGLINEYGNACFAIENGEIVKLLPLEGLEEIKIDGLTYEAFNTSGGVGSLVNTYQKKIKHLSYKTVRYPGHCLKIQFLMNDLKLNEDRETLKHIFERALPKTHQDVVLVYVSVTGIQGTKLIEENYTRKFYPHLIHGEQWSAVQLTTSSSACAVVDLVLSNPNNYHGFVRQEDFSYSNIINNYFGKFFIAKQK